MSPVWMTHPSLTDRPPVEVPESAYRAVWRARGWQKSDPPVDTTESAVAQTTPEPTPARKRKES